MFRFAFYNSYMRDNLHNLFSPENAKTLFMVSQMTKIVNESIGHSSEFFESALELVSQNYGKNNFEVNLNENYYNYLQNNFADFLDTIDKDYEIVSATGTLSMDGCHIHVSLSDVNLQTIGGHLKDNCLVNVTAEIVTIEFTNK